MSPPSRFLRRTCATYELLPADLEALDTLCEPPIRLARHTELIAEGDPLGRGYILEEGWTCRHRMLYDGRRQILDFGIPGDCLGVVGAMVPVASSSVSTITAAVVYPFSTARLIELERRSPRLKRLLDWCLSRDMAILQEHVVCLGRRDARERLAYLLLELLQRLRLVGLAREETFDLPVTQEILGDALGLSVVHVNRTLRRLNNEGIIVYRPGLVSIRDVPALADIADFESHHIPEAMAPAAG